MATKTNELPIAQSAGLTDNLLVDTSAGTKILPVGRLPLTLTADKLLMPGGNMSIAEYYRQYSNRNLLDNAYWAERTAIINQRGKTEYTGVTYTIDRWKTNNASDAVTLHDGYINVSLARTSAWFQPLEQELNAPHTLSFLFGPNSTGTAQIGNSTFNIEGGGLFSAIVSSGSNVRFWATSDNFSADVIAAKLELGPVQTLAHKEGDTWVLNDPPPDQALELMKCQRYYQVYPVNSIITMTASVVAHAPQWLNFTIPLAVPMRAVPSCNIPEFRINAHDSYSSNNESYYTVATPSNMAIGRMGGNLITFSAYFSELDPWDKNKLYGLFLLEPLRLSADL